MPDLGYEEEEQEFIKIAQITFAYDNMELINSLKTRGNFIKNEKWQSKPGFMTKLKTMIQGPGSVQDVNKKIANMLGDPYLLNKF